MSLRRNLLAVLISTACASSAMAGVMYTTGQDANADGKDDKFTVNGAAAFLVTANAFDWPVLPDSAVTAGKYISWHPVQNNRSWTTLVNRFYNYGFQFDWAGGPLSTEIDFNWVSDDYLIDITLNGVSLGVNTIGTPKVWTVSHSASVTGNVAEGLNTINFWVKNNGGGASGLAADFTVHEAAPANDVPEPASFLLFGLGLALIPVLRKRPGA